MEEGGGESDERVCGEGEGVLVVRGVGVLGVADGCMIEV